MVTSNEIWRNAWSKKPDGNYARMLQSVLKKSLKEHPRKKLLYGHLPPISQNFQVRWARHFEHCWRRKDEIICDDLEWTRKHGYTSVGRRAKTYIHADLCGHWVPLSHYQVQWPIWTVGERESKDPRCWNALMLLLLLMMIFY